MKLATGHPFDDEHGTGANRTAQLGSDLRMSSAALYIKQSTAACEHTATPAVGKKSEVADADQALGQNVDQESAEGKRQNRQDLEALLSPADHGLKNVPFEGFGNGGLILKSQKLV